MDVETQTKIIQLLDAVVSADGVITDGEREFVDKAIERFRLPTGLPPTSLRDVGSATATLRGLGSDAQSRVLALLVEAAVVDGKVDPRERALLLAAAAALGIEATALEERIARRLKSSVAGL